MNTYVSIITLNVNGLNTPIKTHQVADWILKKKAYNLLPTRDPPQGKGYTQIESGGMEKDIHANGSNKKAGVTPFISNKIDCKAKEKDTK